jgi:menaquinone-dependent protoporphyrinogen oxidase
MARIAVIFATTSGQTARVAQHVVDVFRRGAHSVDAIEVGDTGSCPPLDRYDAAIVAGSVRMGKFQPRLVEVVRAQRDVLHRKRTAFLAVSLSAARKSESAKREVKKTVARFIRETRFRPDAILPVAGALFYTKYGFFLRLVMRLFSRMAGGDTDTSRDYEYTDWKALTDFARRFSASLGIARAQALSS